MRRKRKTDVRDRYLIECRPLYGKPMTTGELAEFDQVCAAGDLEEVGSWLLRRGFEFRIDLGDSWLHVSPDGAL